MFENIEQIVTRIKHEKPLILNITNDVTMDFVANGLLSLGASPVMSQAPQEAADLIHIASSVIINPGTLNDAFIQHAEHVCELANACHKPIVLDPVGAGASLYRTSACKRMLAEFNIAILRGNASEIIALADGMHCTKGVDSHSDTHEAIDSAKALVTAYHVVVVISGAIDIIVDVNGIHFFERGSPLMPRVTGTGCLLSAIVGTFHAVHRVPFEAAAAATLFYSVCGEMAAEHARKPGSFKVASLDALYTMPKRSDYAKI
ncbi:MAG TPA: hydroxyethylthiazole kinase [Legionella sp.]|nr:hydroxyethylthiazole kinase [Legionella sp.]